MEVHRSFDRKHIAYKTSNELTSTTYSVLLSELRECFPDLTVKYLYVCS